MIINFRFAGHNNILNKRFYFALLYKMSTANVIPSAPPPGVENFHPEPAQLYPNIPEIVNAENFRLTEISKIEKEIAGDVEQEA